MFAQTQLSFLLLAALGIFQSVDAHGRVANWTMADGNKPGQDYGAVAPDTAQRLRGDNLDDFRIVTDPTLACNSPFEKASKTWDVAAGDTVTPTWTHSYETWPSGHAGPIIEYMAACPDSGCDGVVAMDADWFKIGESIEYENQWASLKIRADGKWPIKIPSDIKKGHYLLRHEIISIHGTEGLPQIYPVCIQINLSGSGTTVPKDTYKFPDIYNNFDTTFKNFQTKHDWDEYKPAPDHEFVAPGPPLYDGSGGGNSKSKRTGTGAPLKISPGAGAAIAGKPADTYTLASTAAGAPVVGASTIVDPLAPTAAGVSAQAGVSALPDPYATAIPSAPVAGASSVANPIDPAVPVPSAPAAPAGPLASPPVGGPIAGDPNAPAGPPPAPGAGAANPAPSIDINLSNKGVDNGAAADGAAVDKTLPAPSGGLEDANAGTNTTDGVSAFDTPATALAAGANAAAPSVISSPATAPAVTGASEYASNIQGGDCLTEHWRCQKKADGTMFLEVCKNKADGSLGYEWAPSNPLCPSVCDDSKPQNPICL